jgi:hypothetical protein
MRKENVIYTTYWQGAGAPVRGDTFWGKPGALCTSLLTFKRSDLIVIVSYTAELPRGAPLGRTH